MTDFLDKHKKEIIQANYWQQRGREKEDQREACADKIEEIYDRLESLYKASEKESEERNG